MPERYKLRDGLALIPLPDGGALLVDGEGDELSRFNPTGALLADLIETGATVNECADLLAQTYGRPPQDALAGASALVRKMSEKGWLTASERDGREAAD